MPAASSRFRQSPECAKLEPPREHAASRDVRAVPGK
jgi:hypothetical protein